MQVYEYNNTSYTAIIARRARSNSVSLYTIEAEYILLLSKAAEEGIWLRQLVSDLKNKQTEPLLIYEDNLVFICLSKNAHPRGRLKHIEVIIPFCQRSSKQRKDQTKVLSGKQHNCKYA